jgi:TolB-like protein/Tfp pilus assembly protein PilF
MADEQKAKRLEIAHVLFIDIVGYSKLLTDEQSESLQELNQIVRNTEAAREAEAAGKLTILPTGDGMALVFSRSVEEPVECALEISRALRAQPSLPVRMGIHSGPVHHVKDANERENIAGVGINIAQRVMDCGDAGHILVSKRVADDLAQQRRWQPYLHELGDVEVKHGVVVSLVNLYAETIGNPAPPSRIEKTRGSIPDFRVGTRKALSPFARAILIIVGLLIALIFVLAIVSVIFAPAIMRTLDQHRLATLPQPSATAPPSLSDTINSAVTKKITDALQDKLSRKKNAAVEPPATGSAVPEKSIAVLPFENLSRDPDNAYFTEGIQEEILTRLAKIAELKVISRTSTQRFKSAPNNLREISQQLGVANILEGSVQKAADQVRVSVQLISAQNDSHLWAETYDRKLTDIFAVESDIAKTVAETLRVKLTGSAEKVLASKPTEDPEAHQLYLKGRYFWNRRTEENLNKAIACFQQAIEKDPSYALAYAGLADCYGVMPYYVNRPPKDEIERGKAAARRAIALDDSLGEAHTALASLLMNDLQFAAAEAEFRRALVLNPNYATAHQWYGDCLYSMGRFNEALTEVQRAHELDPLSLVINCVYAAILDAAGHHDEALKQVRSVIELDPNFTFAYWVRGQIFENHGELDKAVADYERAKGSLPRPACDAMIGCIYARTGRTADAQRILDQLLNESQQAYVPSYFVADIQAMLGNKEEALRLLEKAYDERSIRVGSGGPGGPKTDKRLDSLRGDPRFEQLLAKFTGDTK